MQNPSCIGLLLNNNSYASQQTKTVSSLLSDFRKLVLNVLKISIPKRNPRQITYRDDNKFDSLKFNNELKMHLRKKMPTIVLSLITSF